MSRSTETRTQARFPLTIAILALAGVGIGGCDRSHEAAQQEARAVVRAPVAEAVLLERPVEIELFGSVEAEQTTVVSARVMAMVTSVSVRAGDRVARGETLIEIDPQAAQGQLAQARGALAQARAALVLSGRNLERFEALAATDAASQLEVDTARMHHDQARGAVEQAEGAVQSAASVASDARVVAPFDARVARRMVEVGDLAAPGRPLLMLESEGGRRLTIEVPESSAAEAGLSLGKRLSVGIDVRPDLGLFDGEIVELSSGVDPLSHTLTIKLQLPFEDLLSGSSGRARLPVATRSLVVVPRAAVVERGGLSLVVLATPEGLAATRAVTVGGVVPSAESADRIEVLSGLAGGETVLLGLAAPPPAGARVEIES